jgi:hypothetical protein
LDRGCLYLAVTPFRVLDLGEQLGEAHVQSLRYPVEVDDSNVALAPLDPAHVGPVELRILDERLLGCIPALP